MGLLDAVFLFYAVLLASEMLEQ